MRSWSSYPVFLDMLEEGGGGENVEGTRGLATSYVQTRGVLKHFKHENGANFSKIFINIRDTCHDRDMCSMYRYCTSSVGSFIPIPALLMDKKIYPDPYRS